MKEEAKRSADIEIFLSPKLLLEVSPTKDLSQYIQCNVINCSPLVLSIIISAIMPQHEECNSYYEDFEKSERSQPCDVCNALDGRRCLGVSHKRKDTGIVIDAQFNITALKLILSLGSPLTSPTRSRFSVI